MIPNKLEIRPKRNISLKNFFTQLSCYDSVREKDILVAVLTLFNSVKQYRYIATDKD